MIDIILHLFVIVPLFILVKELRKPYKTRLIIAATLISLISIYYINNLKTGKLYMNLIIIGKNESIYDLIGISPRGYTSGELKKRYHSLSRQYHPDKNPEKDAADKFIKIKEGKFLK